MQPLYFEGTWLIFPGQHMLAHECNATVLSVFLGNDHQHESFSLLLAQKILIILHMHRQLPLVLKMSKSVNRCCFNPGFLAYQIRHYSYKSWKWEMLKGIFCTCCCNPFQGLSGDYKEGPHFHWRGDSRLDFFLRPIILLHPIIPIYMPFCFA